MSQATVSTERRRRIRVLVIDDSALVRTLLTDILESEPEIEVVGTASDAIRGLEKIAALNPDVITLDIDMPRLDGLSMLDRLMPLWPLPVVMISALTRDGAEATLKALELGAVDFIAKPMLDIRQGIEKLRDTVVTKVRLAAEASVKPRMELAFAPSVPRKRSPSRMVVAIGASTGGVAALNLILQSLPADAPPIVIAQHMPPMFTEQFARRLNNQCTVTVKEARHGEPLLPGHAYVAPGDKHLELARTGAGLETVLRSGALVNGHMPSVDVLFASVAETVGRNALGMLLTGMGKDGAQGLLQMRNAGAATVCQDEATSLIYGMPQAAVSIGAATVELPLADMPGIIMSSLDAVDHLRKASVR